MRRLFIALIAATAGIALATPAGTAFADPPGHAKGHKGGHHGGGHGGDVSVSLHFGEDSQGLIVDYYRSHPGKRKKYKPLPPGIRKNLAVGKPLPPGIERQTLPEDLHDRLPPLPDGYARLVVGDSLVIVDGGGVVIDIFVEF